MGCRMKSGALLTRTIQSNDCWGSLYCLQWAVMSSTRRGHTPSKSFSVVDIGTRLRPEADQMPTTESVDHCKQHGGVEFAGPGSTFPRSAVNKLDVSRSRVAPRPIQLCLSRTSFSGHAMLADSELAGLRSQLRAAAVACTERCLYQSAKWSEAPASKACNGR